MEGGTYGVGHQFTTPYSSAAPRSVWPMVHGATATEEQLRTIIRRRAGARISRQLTSWQMPLEIFLDLYLADIVSKRLCVSLSRASNIPAITDRRWLGKLDHFGWSNRLKIGCDARRYFICYIRVQSDG
jgi:hypothetical protein